MRKGKVVEKRTWEEGGRKRGKGKREGRDKSDQRKKQLRKVLVGRWWGWVLVV